MAVENDQGQTGATGDQGTQSGSSSVAAGADKSGTQGSQSTDQQGASRTSAQSGFTFAEDRKDWVPPHRFREVSEKAGKLKDLESQIAERDRKIAALAGVQPVDPKTQKAEQVKEAFLEMFPQFKHLANLSDEQMQALLQTPQRVGQATEAESREWARHGKTQLNSLYSSVADVIGADTLNDDQKSDLKDSFASWFKSKVQSELQATGGESSATLSKYEDGDQTLIEEFTKRYTANWVEPARRKLTQQTLTRTRPVPNSQGRAQVTSKRPEKFNSLDERLDYAASMLQDQGVLGR